MDPDVPPCALPAPVLLMSLCGGAGGGRDVGADSVRSPTRPGCCLRTWGGSTGARSLLLPSLLLLLALGVCTCAFLLRWVLLQGLGWTHPPKPPDPPDLLDLRGGEGRTPPLGGGLRTPAPPRGQVNTEEAAGSSSAPVTSPAPSPRVSGVSARSTEDPAVRGTPEGVGVSSGPSPTATARPSPSSAPPLLVTTTLSPGSGHARRCNETEKTYCVNGGDCYFIHGINQLSCKCPPDYFGPRCRQTQPLRLYMPKPYKTHLGIGFMEAEELYQKRVLTVTGICVALLVVGIVCVVAYCKTKKQRKKMHSHLRQNMCADHPTRTLANGPNHPGPGPEEIPMVDYISKNVPATERVIRHAAETSFPGSRANSRSHHSSTPAHSSNHRQEGRTWSLDRTGSALSEARSGVMTSSSVGTSKCSSPACMEAWARRSARCGVTEPHRPAPQYGDSFDSLWDSPSSERYVSALTTPARLSPVDLLYSLPPQVPTFQITSPNASHALSLPPATRSSYHLEDDQPLLRRYQVPLHDVQRADPYRQTRRTYLNDSTGSLPSSPYRLADEEDYETTQEYLSSLEQPKRSASGGGGKRWRRSRLNGHASARGQAGRDYGPRGYFLSDSESEEEEQGESTPFLSMQNMNAEPVTVYRAADSRTSHASGGRHGARGNTQARAAHSRSKQDPAPR